MIDFEFTAKEKGSNKIIKGVVQADSESAAARLLGEKNLFITGLKRKGEGGFNLKNVKLFSGIREKDKVIFTRQLATLVKAGLPMTQALNTAVEQVNSKALKLILDKIKASVEGGASLADSFGQYPDVFSRTFVSLINAGEQSGTLDKTLERLATQMEKDQAIKAKIRGAMIYPLIVLVVIIGVVIFMLVTVLPQIKSLYTDLGKDLPIMTSILLFASNFVIDFWWLTLLMLIAIFFGIRAYVRTPKGRYHLDSLKLQLPPFHTLFRKVYMARFSRTLGVLVVSGVPILEALNITGDAVSNEVIKKSIIAAAGEVKGGKALSATLARDEHFTTLVPQMIKIGEDSGTLGDMLDRVANFYEDEVDQAIKNLSTFIEPALMVVMGTLVALIIIAVLFPVYNLVGSGLDNIGTVNSGTSR